MKVRSFCFAGCVAAGLLSVLSGCSDSGLKPPPKLPDTVTVTGNVTLDGKPIEGAAIRFAPTTDQGFHGATGVSDASGKYELFTDLGTGKSRPGAVPGAYVVYVSRLVKPDGSLVPPDSKVPPMMSGARESIPMKYSNGQLKYEVKPEGGTFDLNLDSKPESPKGGPGRPGGSGGPSVPGAPSGTGGSKVGP